MGVGREEFFHQIHFEIRLQLENSFRSHLLTRFLFFSLFRSPSSHRFPERTELYGKSGIKTSKRISNPGCFATNTQLLIAPLLPFIEPDVQPTVFGISGYSGAGTKSGKTPKIDPEELKKGGGVRIYSLTDHIHEREAGFHLGTLREEYETRSPTKDGISTSTTTLGKRPFSVAFIPSVAPWFSGILSTVSIPLAHEIRASEVRKMYEEFYADCELVKIVDGVPEVGDIMGRHGVRIGGFQVHSSGKRVVVVVSFLSFFLRFCTVD